MAGIRDAASRPAWLLLALRKVPAVRSQALGSCLQVPVSPGAYRTLWEASDSDLGLWSGTQGGQYASEKDLKS